MNISNYPIKNYTFCIKTSQQMQSIYLEQCLENSIKYLNKKTISPRNDKEELFFFCAEHNGKVVAVAKLKTKGLESPTAPSFYNFFSFCSVQHEHQGLGLSKILLDTMFSFLADNKETHLLSSGYSKDGHLKLRPRLLALSDKYNILFKDRDMISFP